MTPHVRAKIYIHNHLCQTIRQNRQTWIDASRDAIEAIKGAKTENWKDLLQDAMSNWDGPNMSKVILGLKGTPDANSANETMSDNGRTITNIKTKANIFVKHCARVSKLSMSKAHRDSQPPLREKSRRTICRRWKLCFSSSGWVSFWH